MSYGRVRPPGARRKGSVGSREPRLTGVEDFRRFATNLVLKKPPFHRHNLSMRVGAIPRIVAMPARGPRRAPFPADFARFQAVTADRVAHPGAQRL